MRLMHFKPEARYNPGKGMLVADALSRSPLHRSDQSDMEDDVSLHVSAVTSLGKCLMRDWSSSGNPQRKTSTLRCHCNTPPAAGQSTKKLSNWQREASSQ